MKGVSKKILAAALAVIALPVASQAASIVLSYNTIQYSTSPTFATFTTVVAGVGNTAITLNSSAAPYYVRFNINAVVVGDSNTAAATSGYIASDPNGVAASSTEPAVLGLGAFGSSVSNTNGAFIFPATSAGVAVVANGTNTSSAAINTTFGTSSKGVVGVDGSVGTGALANQIAGGVVANSVDASDSTQLSKLTIGTGTGSNIYSRLTYIIPANTTGTAVLAAVVPTTGITFVADQTVGNASTAPTYTNRPFTTGDTMTAPGTITFNIAGTGIPEPASLAVLGLGGVGLISRRRKA